ncbi:MAG: transposase [Sedimentisphaerales bacterium]|nr:transposase [Sedimentisphaerales bacterium]
MSKAIHYALNQWDALVRYTSDPRLSIDNNLSERTLRMVVVGRKNYLFAGSEAGAERAAIIYSLVASCKLMGMTRSLHDVLKKVTTWPLIRSTRCCRPVGHRRNYPLKRLSSPKNCPPESPDKSNGWRPLFLLRCTWPRFYSLTTNIMYL